MGEDIPTEPPGIDPAAYYCVTLAIYFDSKWDPTCNRPDSCKPEWFIDTHKCCVVGANIIIWNEYGLWCLSCWEICPYTGYTAQKLISMSGPMDYWTCQDTCL